MDESQKNLMDFNLSKLKILLALESYEGDAAGKAFFDLCEYNRAYRLFDTPDSWSHPNHSGQVQLDGNGIWVQAYRQMSDPLTLEVWGEILFSRINNLEQEGN